jgi:hypothetical protein
VVKDVVEDLIKLELLKNSQKNDKMTPVCELYNLLGPEKFAEVIELMNGRTVEFPSSDSFKETVMTAIYYYYRFFKNKDWTDIDSLFDDEDISHIKMGIRTTNLHQFILKQTQLLQVRKGNDNG